MIGTRAGGRRFAPVAGLLAILLAVVTPAAAADPGDGAPDRHTWFAVSEDRRGADVLTRVDPGDRDPATNEIVVGTTGTGNIEAIALEPGSGTLFAANAEQFGTLDPVTGRFSPKADPIGAGGGAEGRLEFSDVDGLAFDPDTGALYGTHRREREPDLLIRIDPDTGTHVPGAFGAGVDYLVVAPVGDLHDVGDIAFAQGALYAIANRYGDSGDHLVRVDPATGGTTDIGPVGTDDVQGLCASPGGLHGSTGNFAPDGEGIWDIDTATGQATNGRRLDDSADYESLACPMPATPTEVLHPALALTTAANPTAATVGQDVECIYTVANTGDAHLTDIAVKDSGVGPVGSLPSLAPGEQRSFVTHVKAGAAQGPGAPVAVATGVDEAQQPVVSGEAPGCHGLVTVSPAPPPPAVAGGPSPAPPAVAGETASAPPPAGAGGTAPAPPVVAGETQTREPLAAPMLPRTGGSGRSHMLLAGLALAVGGLAIVGGQASVRSARR